jgi:hypothetical protein
MATFPKILPNRKTGNTKLFTIYYIYKKIRNVSFMLSYFAHFNQL